MRPDMDWKVRSSAALPVEDYIARALRRESFFI
jgi:hypothetical protein